MGRPVNKKYFGSGSGNQIKVRFKTGGTEYDGYVVSQRGTNKFKVSDGTRTIVGRLVNKSSGGLDNGELIINVLTDAGVFAQATKLYNRVAIIEGNQKVKWNFASSLVDSAVQIADVEGSNTATITISVQPANVSTSTGGAIALSVTAAGVGDLAYQWEVNTGSGFTSVTGATSSSYSKTAVAGDDADIYRVVVSSTSGAALPVTSNTATITIV